MVNEHSNTCLGIDTINEYSVITGLGIDAINEYSVIAGLGIDTINKASSLCMTIVPQVHAADLFVFS